jgi:hypothetical protein
MSDDRLSKVALGAILILGLMLRVHNLDFGLPSLWDDDEPFFMMFGIKLITNATLNPGWFGHPGTITIYLLALTDILVYLGGWLAGGWSTPAEFIKAAYADPALLMIPARMTIVIPAVAGIWLTWRIAGRLVGPSAALIAALILALSPLHIDLSQVIRTDVQMTFFLLLSIWAALPLQDGVRWKNLIWSSIFAALAGATKWPGLLAITVPLALVMTGGGPVPQRIRRCAAACATAVGALLLVSPFILLDHRKFLADVLVEGRPHHLSQTGGGPLANLGTYVLDVIPAGVTMPVALLAVVGLVIALRSGPRLRWPIVFPLLLLLTLISVQHILWARWAVPLLPFIAILAALAITRIASVAARFTFLQSGQATAAIAAIITMPLALAADAGARERSNDTRDEAVRWLFAHVPPDKSVAVETPAIIRLQGPWALRYPLGDLGCVDPRAAMAGGVDYGDVSKATKGRININLATIAPERIDSCKVDYLVINELDRYRAERDLYPAEIATYRALTEGTDEVATFVPRKGEAGGSIVRIFRRR